MDLDLTLARQATAAANGGTARHGDDAVAICSSIRRCSNTVTVETTAHLVHDVTVEVLVRDARLVQAHVQVQVLQGLVVGAHVNDARQHPPACARQAQSLATSCCRNH